MSNFNSYLREEKQLNEEIEQLFEKEMSSDEVAKELGISRQAVHKTIRKSLGKIYSTVKELNKDSSPFEIAVMISQMMDIDDLKEFFTYFPSNIKKEIVKDAENHL